MKLWLILENNDCFNNDKKNLREYIIFLQTEIWEIVLIVIEKLFMWVNL